MTLNSFYVKSCTKKQNNLINIFKEMFFKMLIDVGHFSVLSPHTVDFLIRRKELIYNGEKQHSQILKSHLYFLTVMKL